MAFANRFFDFDETVVIGDDLDLSWTFTDENGDAVDISGWTFFYTAKADLTAEDSAADLAYDHASFTVSSNTASLTIPDTDTDDLTANTVYHQDLQIKDADSKIKTLGLGKLKVISQVTKRIAALS